MTDREKIIETLRASGYGFFITHEITNADEALADTADALIAAGIRDINQKGLVAVNGEVSIVTENIIADVKDALDGNLAEWKRRAEVAEKERDEYRRSNRIVLRGIEIIKRNIICYCATDFPNILQQAEREIAEEERK